MSRSVNFWPALCACTIIFILFRGSVLATSGPEVRELLHKMEAADESYKTLTFNFTQKIVFTLTGETQARSGRVIFRKPDGIRIEQTTPAEQTIIGNGKRIWIYTPAYHQVVVDNWKTWLAHDNLSYTFFGLAKSFKRLEEQYSFTVKGEDRHAVILLLSAKNRSLPDMKFWVDNETYFPVSTIVYVDQAEIQTETQHLEINRVVDPSTFKMKTPSGTKIITLDKHSRR